MSLKAQVGVNTDDPKASLHVIPQTLDGTTPEGIIFPNLTRAQLKSKDALYGSVHKGAAVYITTIDGTASEKTKYVTSTDYYYFDGTYWRNMSSLGPWMIQGTTIPATSNTDSIYQTGNVVVGSKIPHLTGTLLELKTQQSTATITSTVDNNNVTSTKGGFLLPKVKLVNVNTLEPFLSTTDPEFTSTDLKYRLAGLMVYNISDAGVFYPAVYIWNGENWQTSQTDPATSSITGQPAAFTFYEKGTESLTPLVFNVSGLGTWTYQWYQITGNNIHVRIATPVGTAPAISGTGAQTSSFSPTGALKGSTLDADNTGYYRFYCVAQSSFGARLESSIAEVAVGCGAKNNLGEWISFMCFNLGAQNGITIQEQKDYNVGAFTNNNNGAASQHLYISGEENVWGSLFQWGRIADGHEKTNPALNNMAYTAASPPAYANGNRCSTSDNYRPLQQIAQNSSYYGKFIYAPPSPYSWYTGDLADLWRSGRFIQNDPCAHYNTNGSYQEFWHNGTDTQNNSVACTNSNTAWRLPSQDEWGEIYRGGMISGSSVSSTANTWVWYNGTSSNYSRGYEIKPDGITTTLFLPTAGYRSNTSGQLYSQGTQGSYWSSTIITTNSYFLFFNDVSVNPAASIYRAYGYSVRCIKNS